MRGEAVWIDCPGGRLRLGDFARVFKVPYRTLQGRLKRGEHTFEQLSRPPEARFSKSARSALPRADGCEINSLLAGWKLVDGVLEAVADSTPSASTA